MYKLIYFIITFLTTVSAGALNVLINMFVENLNMVRDLIVVVYRVVVL